MRPLLALGNLILHNRVRRSTLSVSFTHTFAHSFPSSPLIPVRQAWLGSRNQPRCRARMRDVLRCISTATLHAPTGGAMLPAKDFLNCGVAGCNRGAAVLPPDEN